MSDEYSLKGLGYVWEKFYTTVLSLASSSGSVQERLGNAYTSQLMRLEPGDLPADMRNQFRALQSRMTAVKPTSEFGEIQATVRMMSEMEAKEIILKIIAMYNTVARRKGLSDFKAIAGREE